MDVEVLHDEAHDRFELRVGGEHAGVAEYRDEPGRRAFVHTAVEPRFEGRGLAAQLVRVALDETRAAGLGVEARCPYVRRFIERHPEYADLLAPR